MIPFVEGIVQKCSQGCIGPDGRLMAPLESLRSSLGYFSHLYVGFIKVFLELSQCCLRRLERASPSRWISLEVSAELPNGLLRLSTDISD
jgi:hypothetical protein